MMAEIVALPILAQAGLLWVGMILYVVVGAAVYRFRRTSRKCLDKPDNNCDLWFAGDYDRTCGACREERSARWQGIWWPFVLSGLAAYHALRGLLFAPAFAVIRAIGKPPRKPAP